MAQHVRRPAGRRPVHGMHPAQCAAGHDFFHLHVVLAIPVLVTDNRFHTSRIERFFNFDAFRTAHRDRLFKCNQLRAGFDAELDERQPEIRQRAKTKHVSLQFLRQLGSIGAGFRIAELWCRCGQSGLIDIADPGEFEALICEKGLGVVHAALAHANNNDSIGLTHIILLPILSEKRES